MTIIVPRDTTFNKSRSDRPSTVIIKRALDFYITTLQEDIKQYPHLTPFITKIIEEMVLNAQEIYDDIQEGRLSIVTPSA